MNFLAPLALLVGLLVVLPFVAHSLRKGKTSPLSFPAARLVTPRSASSEQRSRLEDRWLLLLRALTVLALALLAASPLIQCSRMSLSRTDGASVSAALIIDDSASMRAATSNGKSRLEEAIGAATEFIATARSGDAFSIVLAGSPARVLTPSTTDLSSVRDALTRIAPTDRETDLAGALALARSIQNDSIHQERPLLLLSDLAGAALDKLELEGVVIPDAGLRTPLRNCAILQATRGADAVRVELRCTGKEPLEGRFLQLVDASGAVLGKPEPAQDGVVSLALLPRGSAPKNSNGLQVMLTPPGRRSADQIADDDRSVVLRTPARLSVAVRADQSTAGLKTGAGTVLQAGIEALDREVRVETLSLLPEALESLKGYSALFIDDPSGFTPELRESLERWIQSGGVGVVFLGPSVTRAPLGSGFHPFFTGAPRWERTASSGADANTAGALGPLTPTWSDVGARYRVTLEAQKEGEPLASWDDGQPLVYERLLGRGLALTVTLPASVDESDLSLRPAFLELLDYAITESAFRKGAQATKVGERWVIDAAARVLGPDGFELEKHSAFSDDGVTQRYVEPALAGEYRIVDEQGTSDRFAMRHPDEHVRQSPTDVAAQGDSARDFQPSFVGISREVALLVLMLSFLELAVRVLRRPRSVSGQELSPSARTPRTGKDGDSGLQNVAS